MAPFRFVHTADLHLDSPLRSLALQQPELATLVGNATRQAFVRIIDLCLDEEVDALLIAGDLYDGDQTSMKTARFLAEQFIRLDRAGIRIFIVRGNHDNLSSLTRELVLPPTVTVFGAKAKAVPLERPAGCAPVVVHGLSFREPWAPSSLLPNYRPAVNGALNIGILHTSLNGAAGHDPYAPCSVPDLAATGFAYWALGHIHRRAVHTGSTTVVMPGMPQGRDINEAGPKSVTLATIHDDGRVDLEERRTGVAQFERLTVTAEGASDWTALVARAKQSLADLRAATKSDHLAARVELAGATPLAWQARRDEDLLTEELRLHGAQIGGAWIEKVEVSCRPPDTSGGEATPVIELRRLLRDEILASPAFTAEALGIAEPLLKALPPDVRAAFGQDEASVAALLERLADEGVEDVMGRLLGPASGEGG